MILRVIGYGSGWMLPYFNPIRVLEGSRPNQNHSRPKLIFASARVGSNGDWG
jgi:hypothetical protein